ncbi:PREDICTED: uncharacterized protein LOC104819955 [Tarenaya hassleriana]|uniref:uncharacterized protein LOC104819955 n=1 Tax=Tarenaya hassleriana TaxID=28532 RepID=UPI00053C5565|nr:PREDICTED: uncharacterized protein LOC104819955 [Tarenaya hassleriana]
MDEDSRVSIILGRPFLNTVDAIIHVRGGRLTMKIGDKTVEFTLDQNLKQPSVMESSYFIDMIEVLTDELFGQLQDRDPLKMMLLNPEKTEKEHIWTFSRILDAPDISPTDLSSSPVQVIVSFEGDVDLEIAATNRAHESKETPVITSSPLRPDWSREDAPEVELKPLPQGLTYEFLGSDRTYPMIINSSLDDSQVQELLNTLRKYRKDIGYTITDIKGINPSLCMHRIHLEDESKTSTERQRRLNPMLQKVVKKEIMKLLDADIIFPISDSHWVSPIQVVPKKGGMTVITNGKNEFIPTRTVIGWRMCIDYRKLNANTRKDHCPLPFIDQMLERLALHSYCCFLDGYSGFFQIPIHPNDQEKTAFTCPYRTYANCRMPVGFCKLRRHSNGACGHIF